MNYWLGRHHSEETKRKLSKINKGKQHMLGKKHTEETKKKMSETRKGRIFSIETKLKMSKSRLNRKQKLGYLCSPETRKKMSIAGKGRRFSEEHKQKLSDARKGNKNPFYSRKHSLKSKEKMSEARQGKKSHLWQGGKSFEPYTIDWTLSLKRSIRERDHYVCQLCEALQEDMAFDVHHIDYQKENCNPNNLITLCHNCHSKTNFNKTYWKEFFLKN